MMPNKILVAYANVWSKETAQQMGNTPCFTGAESRWRRLTRRE